jgi:Holliday junction resolvase-like predicted endonuclease
MTPVELGEDLKLPWYWEGNVQTTIGKFLIAEGWTIESAANTASRQRGIDLVATKDGRRLAVEVKGYPGTVYARGVRAGQLKPTKPNLQARHWLAEAILSALLLGGATDAPEIALAFPNVPRYIDLIGRIRYAIDRLSLRIFLADEGGGVTELKPRSR